ncbi:Cytochrome P450 4C1 [Orchesella cincta]|uniref:Cytochrome P450 4C1 n=1 Tax=Orchesella cincta TaxID=48709 RepID=A0A1D2MUT1_ORCCI|nr:Cytochrome P450 4C1 [Orchesella cincta]
MPITMEFTDLLIWGVVSVLFYYLMIHKSRRDKLLDVFPGPPRPPIIGHTFDFLLSPKEELFPMMIRWCEKYGSVVKTFSGSRRFLMLNDPKYIEKVLTSNVHIKKGFDYDFVRPWLGDGLLMSTGQKWFHRRKMLTPAFHFKILEDFLPIFNEESIKMVNILRNRYGNGNTFDFAPYATSCTLDIICETAMGKSINAQDGKNIEYTQAIREVGQVMQDRAFRPWYRNEFLWKRSGLYRRQEELLKILHGFTDSVISEKKRERKANPQKSVEVKNEPKENDNIYFGSSKKKNAFLDLLLDVQEEVGDSELTDQDIREETDTFMFEGHDTTSVGISFTVYALGAYPEIQAKVREELDSIFGNDKDRHVTTEDLSKMKYLELVLKESLRVYPSVPFIQRHLTSDLKIDENTIIPGDVTVALFIYSIHKNPKYFPEPHVFKPERFITVDGETRNPFAYIPFSAGPRNCIGQKFAMMEEKIIIANMLRNFEIKSIKSPKDMVIQSELTIRSPDGIKIQLTPR